MNGCNRVRTRLSAYLEGDLALADRALMDAHFDGCAVCRGELHALRASVALLRQLPEPPPPPQLAARVAERIAAGETRGSWLRRLAPAPGPPRTRRAPALVALAAAVAGLAWLGVQLLGPVGGEEPEAPRTATRPPFSFELQGPVGAAAAPEDRVAPASETGPARPGEAPLARNASDGAQVDPQQLVDAWRSLTPEARSTWLSDLSRTTRDAGTAASLAAALRALPDPDAATLADALAEPSDDVSAW